MFTYRLYLEDGTDAGTAAYADNVNLGESIWLGPGREYRVLDVVPFVEEGSPFTAALRFEAPCTPRGYAQMLDTRRDERDTQVMLRRRRRGADDTRHD